MALSPMALIDELTEEERRRRASGGGTTTQPAPYQPPKGVAVEPIASNPPQTPPSTSPTTQPVPTSITSPPPVTQPVQPVTAPGIRPPSLSPTTAPVTDPRTPTNVGATANPSDERLALIEELLSMVPGSVNAPNLSDAFPQYTPETDLRRTQFNPVGAELSPFQGVAAGSYAESPAATRARELGLGNLEAMNSAPDRLALVERAIELARERSQPGFDQDLRQVGQKAAAFGRLGAGITTTELGDLASLRERGFNQLREGLTIDALDKTLGDRRALLDAALTAGGQFRGEDLATAGFQQGLRDEARDERDTRRADEFGQISVGRANRDELRDERDFQNQMSQQALQDFIRMTQLEQDVAGSTQTRNLQPLAILLSAAFGGGDPSAALLAGSQQLGEDANSATSALMNVLLQYAQRRN